MPAETAGATAPFTQPVPQIRRWRAFAVLAVSFFMTVVDLTIAVSYTHLTLPTN